MLPDTPHVAEVLFGENGGASALSAGKTVVDMSSISPIETKEFARRINRLGCDYIDAPVSGGEVGAKAGTLTSMCGGPGEAFDRIRSLLERMGKNITLVGGNGDGQALSAVSMSRSSAAASGPRPASKAASSSISPATSAGTGPSTAQKSTGRARATARRRSRSARSAIRWSTRAALLA
jgi:3-hydroxyisobutyrate dehydrogenase-like beta-hydroxyacid dehydrogenase